MRARFTDAHRHRRCLYIFPTLLICAACASPAALSPRSTSVERVKAPVVTAQGALSPRAAERVVDQRLEDLHETGHVREMIDAFPRPQPRRWSPAIASRCS